MRIKSPIAAALLAVLVLLGGCHRAAAPVPSPSETVTPTPTPTLEPTKEAKELWGFPIDDTHDAFEVDTKGELGIVLVTVEMDEAEFISSVAVWDTDDLTKPIQTIEETGATTHNREFLDANFDDYIDFTYVWAHGAKNDDYGLYIWDEEQGRFVPSGNFLGHLEIDEENNMVCNHANGSMSSGADETYRWENGELIPFRKETYELLDDDLQLTEYVTYEWADGQWQEISREEYAMQGL